MSGKRADVALVERGLFESRAKAQEAIAAGLVTVDGQPVRKPSATIADGAAVMAEAPHPWVSRGGVKLAAGLDFFGYNPAGRLCLDVGSSPAASRRSCWRAEQRASSRSMSGATNCTRAYAPIRVSTAAKRLMPAPCARMTCPDGPVFSPST